MGQKRKAETDNVPEVQNTSSPLFAAPKDSIDPALSSIFESSAGPIVARPRTNDIELERPPKSQKVQHDAAVPKSGDEESTDVADDASVSQSSDQDLEESETTLEQQDVLDREHAVSRKRRRRAPSEDIETSYMNRLAKEETLKLPKNHITKRDDDSSPDAGETKDDNENQQGGVALPLVHESLLSNAKTETEEAGRTVFLGNVSTNAMKSKASKKTLIMHLNMPLKKLGEKSDVKHKLMTLRFRSTAYAQDAGPKKAAFAKGELMDQTTRTTNAYAVFSTALAARAVAEDLNATIVLDRHLRADYLGSPAMIDHKRCVFVGNLSLVDEEARNENDQEAPRPRAKLPADAEEGLWRAFAKAGKVESVRVIRDKETRVGKGFAYVQFADENGVEAALLYNDKKFPPLLPRKLRVSRAKRTKRKSLTMNGNSSRSSRFSQVGVRSQNPKNTRSGIGHAKKLNDGMKESESFVFEGHRASRPSGRKETKKDKRKGKPTSRSSRRGAAFKAGGRKKAQEAR